MRMTSKLLFLIWAALIASPASAQIINGSFETPPVPNGSFTLFPGGSTAITGWTVVGSDVGLLSGTFVQSGNTFQAQSGVQSADLTGNSSSMANGLRQIVPTDIGQAYDLQFYVGSVNAPNFVPATVDLSINGGARMSFFNPTGPTTMVDWQLFSVPFTATSAMTNLTFFNGSAANNAFTGLDSVTLTAVPEPTSLALLGLPAVGWWIRRRRASA